MPVDSNRHLPRSRYHEGSRLPPATMRAVQLAEGEYPACGGEPGNWPEEERAIGSSPGTIPDADALVTAERIAQRKSTRSRGRWLIAS
jgi:hypothetical protein